MVVQFEKHETVAHIITAKEEPELADSVYGISQDRRSEELPEMRDMRQKAKMGSSVSREILPLTALRRLADCCTPRRN